MSETGERCQIRDCPSALAFEQETMTAIVGHLSADEIVSERCPDCLNDPTDDTLHRDGCRRIFERGDPREDLQFGPPWKPWRYK